ncbi:hypothetical protein BLOT_000163 [Blomia tropicalis]|nr:hypothetical protein BLOT_000163 [Blomia tropicalis]
MSVISKQVISYRFEHNKFNIATNRVPIYFVFITIVDFLNELFYNHSTDDGVKLALKIILPDTLIEDIET